MSLRIEVLGKRSVNWVDPLVHLTHLVGLSNQALAGPCGRSATSLRVYRGVVAVKVEGLTQLGECYEGPDTAFGVLGNTDSPAV